MKILVIGQGGREHALAWKLRQSPLCQELIISPGNGGSGALGENVDLDISKHEHIIDLINERQINMVVIGPEAPLANGLADIIRMKNPDTMVIGPGKIGAQLEASKAFAKIFMQRNNIPTARYLTVRASDFQKGLAHIENMRAPIVLKADGLAAGKGVIICNSHDEAKRTLRTMLDGQFGEASAQVVIEEFLAGREYSVFVLTDGKDYYLLPEAKDYKRIGEGDNGLNTGGMGAVSPVSYVDDNLRLKTIEQVIRPTLSGLRNEGIDYVGFIFFGMIEVNGDPFVIEYNCRLGDPETEVVLPRIKSDLLKHMIDTAKGQINSSDLEVSSQTCSTVMLVSGGYPLAYEKGKKIEGLSLVKDALLFHAGTKRIDEEILTNGGRVLAITNLGEDTNEALKKCYEDIESIYFEKQYYRTDIGFDL